MKQENSEQKNGDFQNDSFLQEINTNPNNVSVIVNCYQEKKVSLFSQQYLLADKSYYVNFTIEQKENHKVYIMYLTSYRLYMMCTLDTEIISIPYLFIRETQIFDNQIRFILKTGIKCFLIPIESIETANIYSSLRQGMQNKPFCFDVKFPDKETQIYDCLAQMQRMLINWKKVVAIDNKNGQVIKSYPKIIFVPAKIDKQIVRQNQISRYESRIPALTYYSSDYGVGLWRCGYIIKQQNTKYDYAYLESISPNLLIIQLQELQNRRESSYSFNHFSNQIKYSIYKFQNLYNVKLNYEKVVQTYIKDDGANLLRAIGKWLDQIDALIKCSFKIAEQIKNKRSVLIQQYDFNKFQNSAIHAFSKGGVDRACQICALIQIILDPFYRTIKGFSLLIEKQFISFGFPFKDRCAILDQQSDLNFYDSPSKNKETSLFSSPYKQFTQKTSKQQISPTFIQFLQSVSQLINCYPSCFQYMSEYLAQIGYQLYTGKYNNFLFNSLHQRQSPQDYRNTRQFYKHLGMRKSFYNIQFKPDTSKRSLLDVRQVPNSKEYLIWKQYWDMVSKMNCAEKKGEDPATIADFLKLFQQKREKATKLY